MARPAAIIVAHDGGISMLVILHGFPGPDSQVMAYDIPEFRTTIIVQVAVMLGIKDARAIGCDAISMYGPNGISPIKSDLKFRHQYHDGTNYHYELIEIDGIPVT